MLNSDLFFGIILKLISIKLLYLLLLISSTASASPCSFLHAKVKDNDICVFIKGGYYKAYKNQTLVYIHKVDGINTFHSC